MSIDRRLSPQATRRLVGKVRAELGRADRERLETLLKLLMVEDRIRLSEVLTALFPRQEREAALTAFQKLCASLRKAAAEVGVDLALAVGNRSDPPTPTLPHEGGGGEESAPYVLGIASG